MYLEPAFVVIVIQSSADLPAPTPSNCARSRSALLGWCFFNGGLPGS